MSSLRRIDIHSHLIPGVDDGCADLDESLACVRRLIEAGYVGSVCTPHLWPAAYPWNTPRRVAEEVADLRAVLAAQGLTYTLWQGGELRLDPHTVSWMQEQGVPTLAGSRCVLIDFWENYWPAYADEAIGWLLSEGYQPVLAHPERIGIDDDERWLAELRRWTSPEQRGGRGGRGGRGRRGLLLQGNLRPLVGGDGPTAARRGRTLLGQGAYAVLALDMHRPDTLEERLAGLTAAATLITPAEVDRLTIEAPRELLGLPI